MADFDAIPGHDPKAHAQDVPGQVGFRPEECPRCLWIRQNAIGAVDGLQESLNNQRARMRKVQKQLRTALDGFNWVVAFLDEFVRRNQDPNRHDLVRLQEKCRQFMTEVRQAGMGQ